MDLVWFDLIAGRRRRGLFSINHDATTMLHTLSNQTGQILAQGSITHARKTRCEILERA